MVDGGACVVPLQGTTFGVRLSQAKALGLSMVKHRGRKPINYGRLLSIEKS